jgi:hypothetical protein
VRSCEAYFANEGCIVDQPFQPRLRDGLIRCYMGADKVVGFGHQLIKALIRRRRKARTRKPHNQAHALCTLCPRRRFKR